MWQHPHSSATFSDHIRLLTSSGHLSSAPILTFGVSYSAMRSQQNLLPSSWLTSHFLFLSHFHSISLPYLSIPHLQHIYSHILSLVLAHCLCQKLAKGPRCKNVSTARVLVTLSVDIAFEITTHSWDGADEKWEMRVRREKKVRKRKTQRKTIANDCR